MQKLNFKKLRQDMSIISNKIRFLRANNKASWNQSLLSLREQMTILCSIRAEHHGRLHVKKIRNPYCTIPGQPKYKELTIADQERLVAEHIKKYLIVESTSL